MTDKNETEISIRDAGILEQVNEGLIKRSDLVSKEEKRPSKSSETSLKILKMHINLTKMTEDHQNLLMSKREVENELISKNNEISEVKLNSIITQYIHKIYELS